MIDIGVFESKQNELRGLDVSNHTKKKNGLTYLSWSHAWQEFIKVFPDATYTVHKNDFGQCYFGDENVGYMAYTSVTAGGVTREMWLPVMDGANKAMKKDSYTYQVKDWDESKKQGTTVMKDKKVEPISMFDINKTVMRCLAKNLAMFGLALYIYNGEDLPDAIPTGLDCNELITLGTKKGYTATQIEKWLKTNYSHGMEYISKMELTQAVEYFKTLPDK